MPRGTAAQRTAPDILADRSLPAMQRPPWVTNEEEWNKDCQTIVDRARDLVEGRIGVIAAAQELVSLGSAIRALEGPDFTAFIAINSESDHLPTGPERRHWAAEALIQKDREIRHLEDSWRAEAVKAAESLLAKYGTD